MTQITITYDDVCEQLTTATDAVTLVTPGGREAIEEAAPGHVADVRELFVERLTEDQLESMAAIAEAVLAGLDELGESSAGDPDQLA